MLHAPGRTDATLGAAFSRTGGLVPVALMEDMTSEVHWTGFPLPGFLQQSLASLVLRVCERVLADWWIPTTVVL